jgi:hypothetical protein
MKIELDKCKKELEKKTLKIEKAIKRIERFKLENRMLKNEFDNLKEVTH